MYSPCISHLHGQKNHPWPPLKSQRDPMRTPDPRKLRQGFSVQFLPRLYLLVLNFRRVAGWVAGGCWDDYETSDLVAKIPCVKRTSKL